MSFIFTETAIVMIRQRFAAARKARRFYGVRLLLAAFIALFASSAQADNISSYDTWSWNGFSRSLPATATSASASKISTSPSLSSISALSISSTVIGDSTALSTVSGGASLSGVVYYDVDADGVRDSSDWAIRFASVTLSLEGSTVTATATTGKDGAYSFTNLAAGVYTLTLTTVSDAGGTTNAGTIDGVSDTAAVTTSTTISNVVLTAGASGVNFDFAQYAYPTSLITKQLLMGSDSGLDHTTPVPEPSSLALFAAASLLLGIVRRVRRKSGSAA